MANYGGSGYDTEANYGFDEDVAVYSFDNLQENDLGGLLLDEGLDDFNDETFGIGRDAFESTATVGA